MCSLATLAIAAACLGMAATTGAVAAGLDNSHA